MTTVIAIGVENLMAFGITRGLKQTVSSHLSRVWKIGRLVFVSVPPTSFVAIAKQVLGVGYMATHLQLKKAHTYTVSASSEDQSQDPLRRHIFQQFLEKNSTYPINFIWRRFHKSTEPVVRSFLKLFVILFREMLITVY